MDKLRDKLKNLVDYSPKRIHKMHVTAKNISTVPNGTHSIAPNLFLKVRRSSRLYIFRYTLNGKRKDKSIGSVKTMTLKAAREKAMELRQRLAEGEDITAPIKAKVQTFESFSRATLATIIEVKQWKGEHRQKCILSDFERLVYPIIGAVPINRVNRNHILSVLNPIWRIKPTVARRLQQFLNNILSYAVSNNYLEYNPATWQGNLALFLPPIGKIHTTEHHKAPTLEELKELVLVLRVSTAASHKAILFGALTATRCNEFSQAQWDEIDFKNKIWQIPSIRRKDGRKEPFRVPLSTQAIRFLKKLPRKNTWLFPSRVTDNAVWKTNIAGCMHRLSGGIFTVHGMRSTFRDWCVEQGINDTIAEQCLMHSTGNAVVQAYQRSDLLEQRRSVMQAWANELFSL